MNFTRRRLLKLAAAAASLPSLNVLPAFAQEREWKHGLSLFGELKYAPGFKQFDYVNASAPTSSPISIRFRTVRSRCRLRRRPHRAAKRRRASSRRNKSAKADC